MSRTRTTIQNLKGQALRPFLTYGNGLVTFTEDGTTAVRPDQSTCEAYGYFYDERTSTCLAFKPNVSLIVADKKGSNTIRGAGNYLEDGVIKNIIQGDTNTFNGLNRK